MPADDLDSPLGLRLQQLAKRHGVRWAPIGWPDFDQKLGHGVDNTADLAHEIAHWLVAPPRRRMKPYFGLGHPSGGLDFQTVNCRRADKEEALASLLGIGILVRAGAVENATAVFYEHSWGDCDKPIGGLLRSLHRRKLITKRTVARIESMLRGASR